MDVALTTADEKRFWSKVEKIEGGCWVWTAGKIAGGYGHMTVRREGKQVDQLAHRLAYNLLVGPIPEGLEIDHLCRNRACVNPEHLEAVTSRVNTLRGNTRAAANLAKTHCHRGHELNEANVYRGKHAPTQRICRECNRIKCRKYYWSKREKEMSHTVTIQVQVRDLPALIAACRRLSLDAPIPGEHELFAEKIRGYAVKLKDWRYPVVFQLEAGKAAFDNYGGKWGEQKELDNLLQGYSVELAKSTMRRKGYNPVETLRPDGSILLTATAV